MTAFRRQFDGAMCSVRRMEKLTQRMPLTLLARVDSYRERAGLSRTAAINLLVDQALRGVDGGSVRESADVMPEPSEATR